MSGKRRQPQNKKAGACKPKSPTPSASESDENVSITETPASLKSLQDMILNLTSKVDTLVGNNKTVQNELEDIKRAIGATDESMQAMNDKLSSLKEDIKKQEERSGNLPTEVKWLSKELDINRLKLDEVEQYTRKNYLEIHGVPADVDSSCEEIVLALAEKVEVDLRSTDIEITHRLQPRRRGTKTNNRQICVAQKETRDASGQKEA